MRDVIEKHELADGRRVWIQRVKVPGVRRPFWTVVISGHSLTDEPDITECASREAAVLVFAEILKADVMEEL